MLHAHEEEPERLTCSCRTQDAGMADGLGYPAGDDAAARLGGAGGDSDDDDDEAAAEAGSSDAIPSSYTPAMAQQ